MNLSVLHGANGVAVRKPVGEPKQELIDVQTVMSNSNHVTSFHHVPDLVNKYNIISNLTDTLIEWLG